MRKFAMILGVTALAACSPAKTTKQSWTDSSGHKHHEIYHFADNRYGYQDSNGIWWYMMMTSSSNSSSTTTVSGTSPLTASAGAWTRGAPPSEQELEQAQELSPEQALEIESLEPMPVDAAFEAGDGSAEYPGGVEGHDGGGENGGDHGGDTGGSSGGGDTGGGDGGGGGGE
jgi:hypothetical protein